MSAVDMETGIPPVAPASRPAFRLRGLAVLGAMACSCGHLAFVGVRAVTETPLDGLRQPQVLGMAVDGAAPAGTRARSGAQMPSAATAAVLAAGAAAVLVAASLRDGSRTAMASGHDKRTFRGKLHNASFGKYRLRKTKARRLKKIRDGEIDLENVPQHGQPEPEHAWDISNVLQNRLFYIPQFARDAYEAVHEDYLEVQRAEWKSLMNIKGPQGAFKSWTPPGGAAPPAPKPAPAGGPDDKPKDPSPGPAPTEGGEKKEAPKAEKKEEKPEAKAEEPAPAKEEKAAEEPKAEAPKAEEPKAEEPKAEEPKAEEPKAEAPKAEEPKAEAPKAEAPAPAAGGAGQGAAAVKTLRQRSMAGIMDCKKALAECDGDMDAAMAWLKKKGVAKADKKAGNIAAEGNIASYVHFNSKIAVLVEVNSETDFVAQNEIFRTFASDIAMQIAANPSVVSISSDDVPAEKKAKAKEVEMGKDDLAGKPEEIKEKIVMGRLKKQFEEMALMNQKWLKDEDKTVEQVLKETISKIGENLVIRRFVRLDLGEGLQKRDDDFAAGVEKELAKYRAEGGAEPEKPKEEPKKEEAPKEEEKKEEAPKVAISAAQVKELRTMSGAGIMDTKNALQNCGGDVEKAMEWLKKRGMAKADKKAGNISAEGAIASYVHFNQKIGVIVEVNSETDFVAINAIFKEFAADVAMQIAANPSVVAVSADDVPADVIAAEKAIEMEKEDLAGKPEEIKEKIVMGRMKKKYEEMSLLSQKWLKDEDKTVEQVLKEKIAKLGENIIIRRFERLTLGEGLAKRDDDFAAGVEKELAKYRS